MISASRRLALGTIRDLFTIEAGLVGAPPDVVRQTRDRDARPLVTGLYDWILGLRAATRPTSLLGEALTYAINGRECFSRFLDHPELPMHNNRSELALRGPVVGRKAWLFAGSEGGAQAAATMFTLVGSCMVQGIDPWTYLADVLTRVGRDFLCPAGGHRRRPRFHSTPACASIPRVLTPKEWFTASEIPPRSKPPRIAAPLSVFRARDEKVGKAVAVEVGVIEDGTCGRGRCSVDDVFGIIKQARCGRRGSPEESGLPKTPNAARRAPSLNPHPRTARRRPSLQSRRAGRGA